MDPDIFSVEDLAKKFGCSSDTVDQLARDKVLPAVKYGRSWIFPRVALIQILNERALDHLIEGRTVREASGKVTSLNPRRNTPPSLS